MFSEPASARARRLMRVRTVIALIVASAALGCASLRPANHAAWNDDFEVLLAHLPVAYANYEYAVRVRQLDVAALAARTRKQLAAARTERGSRAAVAGFLFVELRGFVVVRGRRLFSHEPHALAAGRRDGTSRTLASHAGRTSHGA